MAVVSANGGVTTAPHRSASGKLHWRHQAPPTTTEASSCRNAQRPWIRQTVLQPAALIISVVRLPFNISRVNLSEDTIRFPSFRPAARPAVYCMQLWSSALVTSAAYPSFKVPITRRCVIGLLLEKTYIYKSAYKYRDGND